MHSKGFFVTGTDTGVGKTVAATILAAGLGARYWKPIQTGGREGCDTDFVARWIGKDRTFPEAYFFPEPLSPDAAADEAGATIEIEKIQLPRAYGPLVVEGAGGVLVPISPRHTMLDLMEAVGLPVVVVARTSLGTINHTLLTLKALHRRRLAVTGVLFIGNEQPATIASILAHGKAPILGTIPFCKNFTKSWFLDSFLKICFA